MKAVLDFTPSPGVIGLNTAVATPELWGGLECSHVTIHGSTRDQQAETGHLLRDGDLDQIAELGIRTLRYPMLWAHVNEDPERAFAFHARRLARLRKLGITPIVGFLHHGNGPGGLQPGEEGFVEGLANFAETVIRRFPGLGHFTPINEPVTTARIACLYGVWEPHRQDTPTFLRNVMACAEATAAAMARIRAVRPDAVLVQTEDVGRVFATKPLVRQAEYENERRFLGFDLLCGRVDRGHRFWDELCEAGISSAVLDYLSEHPCPPDIIGLDHYLTSDRFLDHRTTRYPGEHVAAGKELPYVDVSAVHIPSLECQVGALERLRELHRRYGLPIAITEVHNGCTREEQLRWLMEGWQAGRTAHREGIDLRAVSIWALFGSYDWNSMMRETAGFYETGAFDVRQRPPRPTAIAAAAKALVRDGNYDHPLLARSGWWRADRPDAGAPVLQVIAEGEIFDIVAGCCGRRRISTCGGADQGKAVWGCLKVEAVRTGVRFSFGKDEDEVALEIDAGPEAGLLAATDAALDLAIDGLTGRFTLQDVGPFCQYRMMPVRAVPRLEKRASAGTS